MKKQVYIQCTEAFKQADLFVVEEHNVQKIANVPFADIAKTVNLEELKPIVLLATTEIVLKEITVPKNVSHVTLQKIIPNLVEENILSQVENIHFSFSKLSRGNYALAWVEKHKLEEWLSVLANHGIKPHALYHASSALLGDDSSWRVWIKDDIATIKTASNLGFSMETPLLGKMLSALCESSSQSPEKIVISGPQAINGLTQDLAQFPQLKDKLQIDKQVDFPFAYPKKENVNLLHSHFGHKTNFRQYKWGLVHAGIVVMLLFVFFMVQQIIYFKQYHALQAQQNAQIAAIYKDLYPSATQVTSPRVRIEQELKQIASQGPFFDLLYNVGSTIRQNRSVTLQSLNYSAKRIKVTLSATNYAEIENVLAQLKAKKLNVVQNKTEQKENKVDAEFTISKGQ